MCLKKFYVEVKQKVPQCGIFEMLPQLQLPANILTFYQTKYQPAYPLHMLILQESKSIWCIAFPRPIWFPEAKDSNTWFFSGRILIIFSNLLCLVRITLIVFFFVLLVLFNNSL